MLTPMRNGEHSLHSFRAGDVGSAPNSARGTSGGSSRRPVVRSVGLRGLAKQSIGIGVAGFLFPGKKDLAPVPPPGLRRG